MDGVTTAEVNLDEVEAQLLEKEIGILLVVLVKADTDTGLVTSMVTAAGVIAGIAVDACLQAFLMDMVNNALQALGKPCGVNEQLPRRIVTPPEIAVIDVDMVETHILQAFRDHGIGLTFDNGLADVQTKGVP